MGQLLFNRQRLAVDPTTDPQVSANKASGGQNGSPGQILQSLDGVASPCVSSVGHPVLPTPPASHTTQFGHGGEAVIEGPVATTSSGNLVTGNSSDGADSTVDEDYDMQQSDS